MYLYTMMIKGSIEAQWMWQLLFSGNAGMLEAPQADYDGMLERMEAAELLVLMEKVKSRLKALEINTEEQEPVNLFIDKKFTIRIDEKDGPAMPLRPLVKALFILFLKHPEGILLKERERYRQELEEIYTIISPNTATEKVNARIGRLMDLQDNSFSEKASVLNARLEELMPAGTADEFKIQGYNGHPRRIPVSPLMIHWESAEE
jgi:hypothetical protein